MKKCLQCGNEFEPSKPKAIYCSPNCRTTAFRKKNKKKGAKRGRPKKLKIGSIGFSEERLYNRNHVIPQHIENPLLPSECTKLFTNEDILKQIKVIKEEKIPKDQDTLLGKKAWNYDQNKRIKELESKLK